MARHFAEVQNGVIQRVILADSIDFCNGLGGTWIETFNPNEPPTPKELAADSKCLQCKNYAGIEHEVITDNDGKIQTVAPKGKARDSWLLDKDICAYIAPVEKPAFDKETEALVWNEEQVTYAVVPKDQAATTQKQLDAAYLEGK